MDDIVSFVPRWFEQLIVLKAQGNPVTILAAMPPGSVRNCLRPRRLSDQE
jgi:hypothetical protein